MTLTSSKNSLPNLGFATAVNFENWSLKDYSLALAAALITDVIPELVLFLWCFFIILSGSIIRGLCDLLLQTFKEQTSESKITCVEKN
jgi:hypothetical protein